MLKLDPSKNVGQWQDICSGMELIFPLSGIIRPPKEMANVCQAAGRARDDNQRRIRV